MMPTHQITHGTQVISDRFGDCKGVVEAVALASIVCCRAKRFCFQNVILNQTRVQQ